MRVICDAKNWSAAAYVRTSKMVCMIGLYRRKREDAADSLPTAYGSPRMIKTRAVRLRRSTHTHTEKNPPASDGRVLVESYIEALFLVRKFGDWINYPNNLAALSWTAAIIVAPSELHKAAD